MSTTASEKVRKILENIINYIYDRVMELDKLEPGKDTSAELKNYIAAAKSVIDMMEEQCAGSSSEEVFVKGLEEFFGDLNESNEKAERGS